jgi:predicted PurR-regulated permease PerM
MHEKPDSEGSVPGPQVDPQDIPSAPPEVADRRSGPPPDARLDRSLALTILTVLAVFYSLYFARTFLLPITLAVMLNFLLSPAVRAFGRIRVPPPLAAAVVVLTMVGLLSLGIYELSGPVQTWADKAPQSLATAQRQLKKILRPIEKVTRSAEQVDRVTDGVTSGSPATEVVVKSSSVASRLLGSTQRALAFLLEVIILLYFLLAAGDLFLAKLIKVLPHLQDKLKAVHIARETEEAVSTYLLANLATNVGEGVVLAGALWLLDMPNPILWGVLAAALEFIPYLGALVVVVVLGIAGLATFPDTGHALAVPGVFLLINFFQANIATPLLLSHRLALNPVAQFVGLSLFFWLWGILGAFLAVPILATFKILCDHIDSLHSIGEFLGERQDKQRPALPG